MVLAKCPYCGKKVGYFTLLRERKKGEHFCDNCRKESKILISKKSLVMFLLMTILSVVITALIFIFGSHENPLGIIFVILPFIVFYFISPLFVDFRPYRKYKEWMTNHTGMLPNLNEE